MPQLSEKLEKLLGTLSDEAEKAALRKELLDSMMRQEEFNKKMNEQDAIHKKNLEWYNRNQGYYNTLRQEYEATLQAKQKAEADLAAARAGRPNGGANGGNGNEPPPAELDLDNLDSEDQAAVSKAVKLARQEAQAANKRFEELSEKMTKLEAAMITDEKMRDGLNRAGDAFGTAMFGVWDYQNKHLADYGKPLDRQTLLTTAAEKYGGNLDMAYQSLTHDLEITKIREQAAKEAKEKADAEWGEKFKKANMPYASGSTGPDLGPLQMRLQRDAKEGTGPSKIDAAVPANGDGRLAALIAQELRNEGKVP